MTSEVWETEQMAIDYLLNEKRKEVGKSLDDVARVVFPGEEIGKARMKLYRLRKPQQSTGAQRRLYLDEFVRICKALELSPMEEFAAVLVRLKEEAKK